MTTDSEQDPVMVRFLSRQMAAKTRTNNARALSCLLKFYREEKGEDLTGEGIYKRAQADREKPLLEQGQMEEEWTEYVEWLHTKCYRLKGNPPKLLSPATAKIYGSIVKMFFSFLRVPLDVRAKASNKVRQNRGRQENRKVPMRAKEVKRLLDVMTSNRDRAIALTMFTSGIDISTCVSLRYGDIMEDLEAGEDILVLDFIQRPKTKVTFKTCIGREARQAIKVHLMEKTAWRWTCSLCGTSWPEQRHRCPFCTKKNLEHEVKRHKPCLTPETFLFVRDDQNEDAAMQLVRRNWKKYATLSGLVSEDRMKMADMNPVRPHALRAGFYSILTMHGMSDHLTKFLMGKTVTERAYLDMSKDELRAEYKRFEEHLSVVGIKELQDIERKFEDRLKRSENLYFEKMEAMEARLKEMERREQVRVHAILQESPGTPLKPETVAAGLEFVENDPGRLAAYEREKVRKAGRK